MTLQRLTPADYRAMPWRNGGGVTHEIALKAAGGRAPEGSFLWRLSLAEVGQSGPFSAFPGLARILTVIEGQGIRLVGKESGQLLEALPLRPTAFSGDSPIQGELVAGPIRDLNLIYDPRRYSGAVSLLQGSAVLSSAGGCDQALFVLAGPLAVASEAPLGDGETLLLLAGEAGEECAARVTAGPGAQVLLVTLTPL